MNSGAFFFFCVLRYTGRECKQKTRKQESEREFLIVPILLKKKQTPTNKQTNKPFETLLPLSPFLFILLQSFNAPGFKKTRMNYFAAKDSMRSKRDPLKGYWRPFKALSYLLMI